MTLSRSIILLHNCSHPTHKTTPLGDSQRAAPAHTTLLVLQVRRLPLQCAGDGPERLRRWEMATAMAKAKWSDVVWVSWIQYIPLYTAIIYLYKIYHDLTYYKANLKWSLIHRPVHMLPRKDTSMSTQGCFDQNILQTTSLAPRTVQVSEDLMELGHLSTSAVLKICGGGRTKKRKSEAIWGIVATKVNL